MNKPEMLDDMDFEPVQDAAQEYLDFLESPDYNEAELEDYENAIFETAVTACFGEDVWGWINEKMK